MDGDGLAPPRAALRAVMAGLTTGWAGANIESGIPPEASATGREAPGDGGLCLRTAPS